MGLAEGSGWVADVAELAGLAVAGRILLAWLPVGRPGSHQGRAILATWAASHLIGLAGLTIGGGLAERVGLAPRTALIVACVALGLLLVTRLVGSPAALVPRHEPAPARWSRGSRIAALAAVAVIVLGRPVLGRPLPDAISLASAIATLCLVAQGLEWARAPAWVQALACVAFAWFLVLVFNLNNPATMPMVLGTTAACAGTIGWLRRGDSRALALAATALTYLAAYPEQGLGIALGLALSILIGTPAPARVHAALWCVGLCLLGAAAAREPSHTLIESGRPTSTRALAAFVLLIVAFAAGIAAGWRADVRQTAPAWNPSGAPRGREGRVFLTAIASGWALSLTHAFIASRLGFPRGEVSLHLGAICALLGFMAALGLTRWVIERPEAA